MHTLQNIAISASAGSGKTYQLTNRFIYLLHQSEKPERIIALTFTRTAAGEFFQKIIEKLCDAAADADKAEALSTEIGIRADSGRYHHLLHLLIRNMHRLNLQTLDSFFFRIVAAFALELGLSGSLNLLDQTSEARMRNEVRDSIVHRQGDLTKELNEFWHAFKQATYGQEQRSVESVVSAFIETLYALFLEVPDAELWGQAAIIWPQTCPWASGGEPDWDRLAEALLTALPADLTASQRKDFEALATKIRAYPVEEKTNTLLDRVFGQAEEVLCGQAVLQCGRGKNNQAAMSGPACAALAECLRAVVWHHLKRALENTQGVYRILKTYHENYDRIVRRPGRLAFADLTHLLSPDTEGSPVASADPLDRQLMDFRLDGQFDHWLFDEFQDTSRPQWEVVANLIDEVVQDGSGTRSLFYVGDTKQCLYLWRNSDDRLFHDIQGHYNREAPRIRNVPLSTSWRSAPAILDAVNAVFSDSAAIAANFSADAATRWQRAWNTHRASPATAHLSGFACWLKADKKDGPDRNELIRKILADLEPVKRGISIGILVRKNSDATEIADYLREHTRLPVHTGSAVQPATDNSAGAALLALLRIAAHPGDTLARGHLQLIHASTPGADLLQCAEALRARLLTDSHESAVRWAARQVASHLKDNDTRHQMRLDQLVEKARAFDQEDRRDIDGLYHFLKDSTSGECAAGDAVIIETIHKSKGLEYDVVLLVNEDKTVRTERRISPLLNAEGKAEWILEPIRKDLMQTDPKLNQLLQQTESQQGFGNLCTLYVAMTRAKRALYMISDLDRVSKGSTVHYLRDLLGDASEPVDLFPEAAYPVLWRTGDPGWHTTFQAPEVPDRQAEPIMDTEPFPPAHPRLHLARPSAGKAQRIDAGRIFDAGEQASDFGIRVHAAFERVEWLDTPDATEVPGGVREDDAATEIGARVARVLRACFEHQGIRRLFTRPSSTSAVWRERAFSYAEGDQLTNGVFDRVHLHRDDSGAIHRAEIVDYKTDRIHAGHTVAQATEHHRPQLETYRAALSKILGLDPNRIDLYLVFTDAPELVAL